MLREQEGGGLKARPLKWPRMLAPRRCVYITGGDGSSTDGSVTLPDGSLYGGFANGEAALQNEGVFARPRD